METWLTVKNEKMFRAHFLSDDLCKWLYRQTLAISNHKAQQFGEGREAAVVLIRNQIVEKIIQLSQNTA